MAEHANPTGVSALAASPVPVSRTRAGDAADSLGKQPEPWPLTWLNDAISEATRIWSPFLPLEPDDYTRRAAKPALEKRLLTTESPESIDPPTSLDRLLHANMGRFTLGLSPYALGLAYADWAIHLWGSPGKSQQLAEKGVRNAIRFLTYLSSLAPGAACRPCIEPLPQDRRFRSEAWQQVPFNLIYQAFLLNQRWWHSATTGIGGVSRHHEQVVAFMTR
jgi:Poly-beta-hydroxybutyrate polymerase N terminal/Poly-beta-hydroxybutyrate polymerase (PhaC) N-terminus